MASKFQGLTSEEAIAKLKEYGRNEIREQNKITPVTLILRQLRKNYILYLLISAAGLSFLVGESMTGIVILLVIAVTVSMSFVQEYKAEQALAALKKMVMPVSVVIRNGIEREVASIDLVPGDMVIIRSGDRVPADCRLIQEYDLRVDEAILTGESKEKSKSAIKDPAAMLREENLVFMGSFVVSGRGVAEVMHTGMNTKFGKISKMISQTEKSLPLSDKINRIASFMVKVALVTSILTGALVFIHAGAVTTSNITHALILVIAIAVSAFPEGLPVVMMTALATGTSRMARKNAIVNRMSIIEALGETTVICSDKTGTITKGEMTVKKIITDGKIIEVTGSGYSSRGKFLVEGSRIDDIAGKQLTELMRCSVLCNNASMARTQGEDEYKIIGSATEGALAIMAAKAGVFKDDLEFEIISEIPFSSERKTMFVYGQTGNKKRVYAKGAPEYLMGHCQKMQLGSKVVDLTEEEKRKLHKETESLTKDAFRTIALAYSPEPVEDPKEWNHNLIFLGIVGMEDPPRDEIYPALEACKSAGITVKMITGDNKETALSIAKQIGLGGKVVEGSELDDLSDNELKPLVQETVIFARVRPEHKLRIVKALKQNGDVVTMTGDGVNDAPALKEADIGVAMGKNGTDVSRSVADLILKDDNFATIVEAIKEGRTIFNNIRKFVTYELSCNYAELSILLIGVLVSPLLGWEVPILTSLQILFMNLVTDDLPSITLALNRTSSDVMQEKPRRKAQILHGPFYKLMFGTGVLMSLLTLLVYLITFNFAKYTADQARTTALITLIGLEIVNAFNYRSFRFPVLSRSPFVNRYLFAASVISVGATLLIIYTPLSLSFNTVRVAATEWLMAIITAGAFLLIFDWAKYKNNRNQWYDFS